MYIDKMSIYCVMVMFTFFVDSYGLTFLPASQQNISLQVSTENGIIQGREIISYQGLKYFSYQGIPFAEPPLDNLRFRAPKSAKPWKGILNTTAYSSGCLELHVEFIGLRVEGAEDCLFLNVFTPINLKVSKKKPVPVIFWIYGGAFLEGEASIFGPENLVENGLVVVTFNYRIGMFGFLSTGDEASPGNYGLKDQNAALRWVNRNIDRFGGDPTRITISGHSAGACSVMYHMFSPKSRGLFSGAIAWSGETTSIWSYQTNPKLVATDIALNLGIDTDNTTRMVEQLRKIKISDLTMAQKMVVIVHLLNVLQDGFPFTPTIEYVHDEAFLTEAPSEVIRKKEFAQVPLMIGTTTMESGLFGKIFDLLRPLFMVFDVSPSLLPNGFKDITFLQSRRIGLRITDKYLGSKQFSSAKNEELLEFATDLLYTKPITGTVRSLSPHIPVYGFISGHPEKTIKLLLEILRYPIDTNVSGVVHGEDLPLIWNYKNFGVPPTSRSLRKKFSKMWFHFASTGNPTPTQDPALDNLIWPPVTDNQNIPYLYIGDEMNIAYNYKKDVVDFWDELDKEYKDNVIVTKK